MPSVRRSPRADIPSPRTGGPIGSVLRLPNYRLFLISQGFAQGGVWMQRIALDWLVLSLTGSVTAVGITTALQFAPVAVFGLVGGVMADRYSKRMLLITTQSVAALLAITLTVLTFTGTVQVGHIYLISLVLGLVTAVDSPARQVFVPELVGQAHLRTAVSVNSTVYQLGGLAGPAAAGVIIATLGEAWAFAINSLGCLAVIVMVARVRPALMHPMPTVTRAPGQLRDGLRAVRRSPPILASIVLVGVVGLVALNLPVVLTAFADRVHHSGAAGFGLFNAMVGIGGILGALLSSRQRLTRMRTVATLGVIFGTSLVVAAAAPTALLFTMTLVLVGTCQIVFLISAHVLVQLGVDPVLQGRVMGVYLLVQLGGRAAGGPLVGWATESFGARTTLLTAGVVMTLAAVAVGLVLARVGSLRLSVQLRRTPDRRLVAILPQEIPLVTGTRP